MSESLGFDIKYDPPRGNGSKKNAPPGKIFDFAPYPFPDLAGIPRREWLYGRHYIRGAVSATIGAPGRAKSTNALQEIFGMSIGRDLVTGNPLLSGPLYVAYLNGEEAQEELDRRVGALRQRFQIDAEDCGGRLFVESTRDKPFKVAVPGSRGNAVADKNVVDALKAWCDRRQIDVLAIDPLISFHSVRESDNGDMDVVCKDAFAVIAGKRRAVELIHHPRKLPTGESNSTVDDARGASAILGAVREARTLNFMTAAEASQLRIGDDERRLHIRIDNGKANMGPIGSARWLRIVTENLPNGDTVACVTAWKLPNPFDSVSLDDLKVVQRVVQSGAFRTSSQAKGWLGWWMAENLSGLEMTARYTDKPRDKASVAQLDAILKTWVKNGVLKIVQGQDETRRKRDFYAVGEVVGTPTTESKIDDDGGK
jgi:hypothetical protein